MSKSKKIAILAYSGGLDSTISIDWIKKNYGYPFTVSDGSLLDF